MGLGTEYQENSFSDMGIEINSTSNDIRIENCDSLADALPKMVIKLSEVIFAETAETMTMSDVFRDSYCEVANNFLNDINLADNSFKDKYIDDSEENDLYEDDDEVDEDKHCNNPMSRLLNAIKSLDSEDVWGIISDFINTDSDSNELSDGENSDILNDIMSRLQNDYDDNNKGEKE